MLHVILYSIVLIIYFIYYLFFIGAICLFVNYFFIDIFNVKNVVGLTILFTVISMFLDNNEINNKIDNKIKSKLGDSND